MESHRIKSIEKAVIEKQYTEQRKDDMFYGIPVNAERDPEFLIAVIDSLKERISNLKEREITVEEEMRRNGLKN